MTVKYICDGCGLESAGEYYGTTTTKPRSWFARSADNKEIHACSRECVKKANENTGDNVPIIPI
jgi:hypothetical protein